jgi:hypothetical protein
MLRVEEAILLLPLRLSGAPRTRLSRPEFELDLEGTLLHVRFKEAAERGKSALEQHWILSPSQYAIIKTRAGKTDE